MTDVQPDNDSLDLSQPESGDGAAARPAGQTADLRAEHVELNQGGANSITAQTVTITQGGAARVRAGELSIRQGGVALARADRLTLSEGGGAFVVIADEARLSGQASTFLLVAGRTYGPVTTAVDVRAAIALGAAFALVAALLRRIF